MKSFWMVQKKNLPSAPQKLCFFENLQISAQFEVSHKIFWGGLRKVNQGLKNILEGPL